MQQPSEYYHEQGLAYLEAAHQARFYNLRDAAFSKAANMFTIANTLRQQEKDTNG